MLCGNTESTPFILTASFMSLAIYRQLYRISATFLVRAGKMKNVIQRQFIL